MRLCLERQWLGPEAPRSSTCACDGVCIALKLRGGWAGGTRVLHTVPRQWRSPPSQTVAEEQAEALGRSASQGLRHLQAEAHAMIGEMKLPGLRRSAERRQRYHQREGTLPRGVRRPSPSRAR